MLCTPALSSFEREPTTTTRARRRLRPRLAGRSRDRFGPIGVGVVFALTRTGEQLLETDDVRVLPSRLRDPVHGAVEIGLFVALTGHLHQGQSGGGGWGGVCEPWLRTGVAEWSAAIERGDENEPL